MKLQPHIHSFLQPQPYIHGSYIQSPDLLPVLFFHIWTFRGHFFPLTYTHLTVWQVELLFTKQNRNDLSKKFHYKKVVGLYETYKKYEKIGGPNSYQNREKWTSVFY